jgi:hypothetical protein
MAEKNRFTDEDDALLAELGIEVEAKKTSIYTAREERIIAGFEEIQKFVQEKGRLPEHGEDNDIFERLYAVRLDQIRNQEECKNLLKGLDHQNLLNGDYTQTTTASDEINDDDLLAQLGVEDNIENSITNLKHVIPRAEKKAAEEIANRTRCDDFDQFKPLFVAVIKDLELGYRNVVQFKKDAGFTKTILREGQFIILGGLTSYIAEKGQKLTAPNGEEDARLRVIYANGTESNILLRSLIRAMYKDETSGFISDNNAGPLFSGENSEDDLHSGTIYVLRSLSDHPLVKQNKEVVHKIGVTGGDVKRRIANAKYDPTFLMAEVEILATYKLANMSRIKLEKVIHNFFASAKFDIEVLDRFGRSVKAQEWFLVPLFIVDEMVTKIIDGTITDYYYEPHTVKLMRR